MSYLRLIYCATFSKYGAPDTAGNSEFRALDTIGHKLPYTVLRILLRFLFFINIIFK